MAVAALDEFKETSPDDFLTLAIAARDDVAVASAELHYTIERSQGSTGPISGNVAAPLDGLGTPTVRGEAALSLATLALKPGDTISYRVRVTDNRPAPRPQYYLVDIPPLTNHRALRVAPGPPGNGRP